MRQFSIQIPGTFYALSCTAADARQARKQVREKHGYQRLPAGTAVWETTPLPRANPRDAARYFM